MSPDVTLVTWRELPELDPDDRPLAAALRERGLEVAIVAWDDPAFDWSSTKLAVLRNPWDYFHRRDEFLAWAERVERVTRLENPLAVVRWNLHKGYLVELAQRGAPVVPTALVRRGEAFDVARHAAAHAWEGVVVKPAVSADSWETHVVPATELDLAQGHLDRLAAARDVLVQPFLAAVEDHGERCLIFLEGEFSHAVRKNPITRGGRWAGLPEGTPVVADAAERAAAEKVLAAAGLGPLLYARVDLVRDGNRQPCLLELELAEPTLFLADASAGLVRLTDAIARRLAAAPQGA
jgi:hypothetical protein